MRRQRSVSTCPYYSSNLGPMASPYLHYDWDPFGKVDTKVQQPTPQGLYRLKRDLASLARKPPPGITILSDEEDMFNVHALIEGPGDTPYERGFFYFFMKIPANYPFSPPRVRFMTTDSGEVRFGPNLYSNGKVCLSILGTWPGPAWSPANTLESLLLSLQTLFNKNPLQNEPGFTDDTVAKKGKSYNERICHETIRVAVIGMLRNSCGIVIPPMIIFKMQQKFLKSFPFYLQVCDHNLHKDGCVMMDPYNDSNISDKFQYVSLKTLLQDVYSALIGGRCA